MKLYTFFAAALATIFMSANIADGIFDNLQLSQDDARSITIRSLGRGLIEAGDLKSKARDLPVETQVEGTRTLIKFARDYSKTEDFKKKYAKFRNQELGYASKKISNPFKVIDKAMDKQLNKGDDEKRMPADPNDLIKQRLKAFLRTSATVDFDAELDSYKQFVNPSYESKSFQWKQCYRAGKDVVAAAREEAKAWLAELEESSDTE